MRGKMAKPEANIFKWVVCIDLGIGGYLIWRYFDKGFVLYLILGIAVVAVAIYALIQHWLTNHPRMPKWAESHFEKGAKIYTIGDK